MYCRKGALQIDNQGRLTLVSGEPILGQSGQIHLNMAPFSINKQGEILQDGAVVDRLKLTEFTDSKKVESHGHGLYLLAGQTNSDTKEVDANASGSKASDSTKVMQGYLEISNVNMMDEMVNMINVTRHFEASSKVLQGYDGMMDSAINVIGDL
jgi:flagellar basal-body rod protein FlgG